MGRIFGRYSQSVNHFVGLIRYPLNFLLYPPYKRQARVAIFLPICRLVWRYMHHILVGRVVFLDLDWP